MTRRRGQWPVKQPVDLAAAASTGDDAEQYLRRTAERARRALVLGSIRAHLEEQPTANSALAVGRTYCADITALSDEVAAIKRSTG